MDRKLDEFSQSEEDVHKGRSQSEHSDEDQPFRRRLTATGVSNGGMTAAGGASKAGRGAPPPGMISTNNSG